MSEGKKRNRFNAETKDAFKFILFDIENEQVFVKSSVFHLEIDQESTLNTIIRPNNYIFFTGKI